MAKKVIQMYDKYLSTTKVYPKIIKECLGEDITTYIEDIVEDNAIPTITITAAQMTSATTAQLTDEQFEILDNSNIATVNLPNDTSFVFTKMADTEVTLRYSSGVDIDVDTMATNYYIVEVAKSTKIATIVGNTVPKGKQLYQHNINCYYEGELSGMSSYNVLLKIINDNSTHFDYDKLCTYLKTNGFWFSSAGSRYKTRNYPCNASWFIVGSSPTTIYNGIGLQLKVNDNTGLPTGIEIVVCLLNSHPNITTPTINSSVTINDIVITL